MFLGATGYAIMTPAEMFSLEVALLPGLARFFIGVALVPIIAGGTVLILHWMGKGEEE